MRISRIPSTLLTQCEVPKRKCPRTILPDYYIHPLQPQLLGIEIELERLNHIDSGEIGRIVQTVFQKEVKLSIVNQGIN